MEIRSLSKTVFHKMAMGASFCIALGALAVLPSLSETRLSPPQFNQITSCVEAPSWIVATSYITTESSSDCNPRTAFGRAQNESQISSRDGVARFCREEISAAEAAAICANAGGELPSTSGTVLSAEPFARAGGIPVDSQLFIDQSNPKLCAALRHQDTVTSTQPAGIANGFCVLNNNRVTKKKVKTMARCGVQCLDVFQHSFRVRRFTTAILSGTEADSILMAAGFILRMNNGAGDVACRVGLSRVGAVDTFTQGDGSIDTTAEFSSLMALPGNVMVVNDINWCSGFHPNAIGCGGPGDSMAVQRYTPEMEGIVWAHEFGHNQGLPHRNDPNAIMAESGDLTHRSVDANECRKFRSGAEAEVAFVSPVSLFHEENAQPIFARFQIGVIQTQNTPEMDIKEFVRQMFIHGVPYEQASKYSTDVVPTLLEMLKDSSAEPYWPNIVVVLGIIGDERTLSALIEFVERDRGHISAIHYRAKTALIMSLGYLINRARSEKALEYLKRGLDPRIWTSRVGSNRASYQANLPERDFDFAKHSLLGLALSGHPKAGQALLSLKQPAGNQIEKKFRTTMSDLVTEALKEHQQIASGGLAEYYRAK